MYRTGEGVAQNWHRAIAWYTKAAENREWDAMHWLGRIYGDQEDCPKHVDAVKAVHWLKLAAGWGDVQSQCALGVHYINGEGVEIDEAQGAFWYRAAAVQVTTGRAIYSGCVIETAQV